jgi:4-hydroxybenzoate polyprenyltransferase
LPKGRERPQRRTKRAPRRGLFSLVRAYLELVRLPNLFTAMADVLAGYLTVTAASAGPGHLNFDGDSLAWLLVTTVCLYGGGVALNDYFDESVDRVERPERPLPSGRISRQAARRFALALFILAGLSAASVGPLSLALTLATALSAVVYDAIGKRTSFGPLNMGLCRFLNLLLGVSAVPVLTLERIDLALLLMVHVTGVTVMSRGEVFGGERRAVLAMLTGVGTAALGLTVLRMVGFVPDQAYVPFLGAYVLVAAVPAARAYTDPTPELIGQAVKWGVLGLVLLDAAFAASFAGTSAGLPVAALLLPSALVARLFAVT